MKHAYNTFLIIVGVALLFGGAYVYFSNDLDAQAATADSPLSSSQGNASPVGMLNGSEDKISQDTAFLATLTSLTKIKIDQSLFSNPGFRALNDNTVVLEASVPGRPNPFAAIDKTVPLSGTPVSLIVTSDATQITTKSAVLNGTLNTSEGVVSTYFEYGPTPTLGKSTPEAKQSLIGTFVANITGLAPESVYFFRAVGKTGGTVVHGEIVSFTTN